VNGLSTAPGTAEPASVSDDQYVWLKLDNAFPGTFSLVTCHAAALLDSSEVVLNNRDMTTTATFSELLRTPNEVIDRLSGGGEVLLTRRDAEPLRLSLAGPAAAESSTLAALAQLIGASLDDEMCDRIASHLSDPFPWIEFLPDHARREFVGEFLRVARACAAVSRFDRLTVLLAAWRGTAEAYADPNIAIDGSDLDYLPAGSAVEASDPRTSA